ncbi:nitronate monooxygenase [Streptococcus sp. zg-86]|uniref:Probable nitronate monooxygenase n=1 Tax=Streptococcus zhangguiae TaxID=2664091 RepID=A0A6I4RCW7_9STRE|nr:MULTISPECIES: nitronate monooxygenase [unclassified Streptococcus]MTB63618.1 nitronate monooxygenase [Streptococcus sp. zg-86]MTB89733.1 nitronate monooxygenase [Streptococcus sp. zg-36]MWV55404.1 nitronate monooxygenase [Streptococcus sp. zg-70]QTH47600.1 nitronate monooxygenase [Streptococcus sp. zg-86]
MANRVTEILGIEKPIIQGPLAWLTNGAYAGAVSAAGGLGVLGISAGQTVAATTVEETVENMRREIRIARQITNNPLGLNVAPGHPNTDIFTQPMLDLMAEEGVKVAVMVGEFSAEWTKRFHDKGIKVIFRAATPTVENTEEAIQGGADIIVATGFDEGGTVPEKAIGTFSIVPMIVDAAKGRVPVMAAGGIADARTAKAAFALGAEGLFVGTAFMMSEESILAQNIKEQALAANASDLLLYRTVPAFYRSLPGTIPNKLLEMSQAGASEEEIFEMQGAYNGMRDGMLFGDLTKGFASFGLGISMIDTIEPVAVIMDKLMSGIEELV